MKRAIPIGAGFVVLFGLVALMRTGHRGDGFGQAVRQKRVADFRSAMTEALKVDESQEDELSDLITTLPGLNMSSVSTFECA